MVPEHGVRVAHVRADGVHAVSRREQRVVVGDHDRIVVHVHHPRGRDDVARDLVHAGRRGQTAAQVEELGDTLLGEEANGAAEESAVRQGEPSRVEPRFRQLLGRGAVGGEIVLAEEQVVVDPGDARPGDIDPVGYPRLVLPGHPASCRAIRGRCCNRLHLTGITHREGLPEDPAELLRGPTRRPARVAGWRCYPATGAGVAVRRVSGILARVSSSRGV